MTFCEDFNKGIMIPCNNDDIRKLIDTLEEFVEGDVKKEVKAYNEEINTFKQGIERTLYLSGTKGDLRLYLDCYTDVPYDDNWVDLTNTRLRNFVGLLYGYLE